MTAAIRVLVAMAIVAVFATSGVQAVGHDRADTPGWKEALRVRSEGLNRVYQLGDFEPAWKRALRMRGEELNRYSDSRGR
jgi:hypothetical protein